MTRYLCIHGHFYQPPRENPWLEDIEQQDSAYPFHDWNERIAAECYRPNSAARILDRQGRIGRIVNNYSRTSFNFGPTLLSWLERRDPETYCTILAADAESRKQFSGHGTALAQAYNHLIMPLANDRDRRTQVLWGVADFVHRFGRRPEGMWLPETAVDLATLELLAEQSIVFTILAPRQAKRVRRIGESGWRKVGGEGIDPRRPYLCRLPSGRSIALFFYQGAVANDIAFGGLLEDGEDFASRLSGAFVGDGQVELVHVATDGETYGHHYRFGEMALAYCLDQIENRGQARLTVYGEFLEAYPPTHEVEIAENTSWSCAHGIERWRADCGCRIGGGDNWTQAWRGPLRDALDWLRDRLAPCYERGMTELGCEPWAARDAYIELLLNREPTVVRAFLGAHAGRELDPAETTRALRLLEMQRHALLMYTSCGWFFDDVSGIETRQILTYAARAIQLAEEAAGVALEDEFLRRLEPAKSNLRHPGDAARLYRDLVATAQIDLFRVAAHHAIASGFPPAGPIDTPQRHEVHCYATEPLERKEFASGRLRLALGRNRVRSTITWNTGEFCFAVLNLGDHNITAGVCRYQGQQAGEAIFRGLIEAFERSDVPGVIRQMDCHFGAHNYTLWHLFRDEQRRVLQQIMTQTLDEIEVSFQGIYENHFPLLRFLHQIRMPIPRQLGVPVELALISRVRSLLEKGQSRPNELKELADQVAKLGIPLDEPMLGLAAGRQLVSQMERLVRNPRNLALMLTIIEVLEVLKDLPIRPDLWRAQNLYGEIHRTLATTETGPAEAEWREDFRRLGDCLRMGLL
jgi:alpha-amylase/alpha-mannosidase (GH57 family)